MPRADRFPRTVRSTRRRPAPCPLPARLAVAIVAALPMLALAQTPGWASAMVPAPSSLPPAALPSAAAADAPHPATLATAAPLLPTLPSAGRASVPFAASRGAADYAANAAVGGIVVETDRDAVPADGNAKVEILIRLLDREGRPLAGTAFVTVEHSGGRLLLPGAATDELGPRGEDADRGTPGVQVRVVDGVARVALLAPMGAQDVRLRVTAGDQEAVGVVSFVPELRRMVAAGLVEGVVDLRGRGGTMLQPVRRGDVFEQEIRAWSREFADGRASAAARTAFYLKGSVRGDVLLTAAYDSDKVTRGRLLRDIQPDRFYPVYGDASLRAFDARSAHRLYLRADHGKSYVLYGDFVTGDGFSQAVGQGPVASLRQRALGAYNRTATGLRAQDVRGGLLVNGFVFNDSLRQVVEEFASQGSGPYALSNNAALTGSEKVEVVVRDRLQPSRIVAVRPLLPLVDYGFEPFSGRILLFSFLPALDENLNPVSLRVTYEVDQGGEKFWVGGADAQWRALPWLEIGGSGVTDRNPLAPYELASANVTLRPGPSTAIVAEVARSDTTVNTNAANRSVTPALAEAVGAVHGTAWRVEGVHEGERTTARGFVGRSTPDFVNAAAPLNGGRGEAFGRAEHGIAPTAAVYAEGLASRNEAAGGGRRATAGTGLRWRATDRLTLDAGVRDSRETVGTASSAVLGSPFGLTSGLSGSLASGAAGGALGFGTQPLDPATGLPVIGQASLAPIGSTLPAGTRLDAQTVRLGAGWRITDRFALAGEVEHDVAGDDRRRVALGGDWRLAERSRLYGRWERQDGWVQTGGVTSTGRSADQLVFGVDTSYLRDTQLFNEYRLRDAASGRDVQVASGVRHFHDLAPGLRATTAYERVHVVSGSTAPAQAVSLGVDYTAHPLWRGSARIEHRRSGDVEATAADERFDTTLLQAMVARKLSRDWTLLARDYVLFTRYAARGDVLQNRAQAGVAYRDTDTNRVNALARIEHKLERDASNATAGALQSRAWILSTHADWHPSRPWWLTGRYAAKWQTDRLELGIEDAFRAQLASGRAVYDVTEGWDIGVLGAVQVGQRGAREFAWGLEAGRLLRQNLWLSVGFNAAGFRGDADLAGYEYTRQGAYVRLRFKFDETLLSVRRS